MVQVLQHHLLLIFNNGVLEAKAALRVLIELIHVAQIGKDRTEIDGMTEHVSCSVLACLHWVDKCLTLELHLLCKLRTGVRATKNLASKLENLTDNEKHSMLTRQLHKCHTNLLQHCLAKHGLYSDKNNICLLFLQLLNLKLVSSIMCLIHLIPHIMFICTRSLILVLVF